MLTILPRQTEVADQLAALPPNFNPQQFPILAAHWFGWHQPARLSAKVVELNHVRLAAALHRLGEAIGADVGSRRDMLHRLAPPAHGTPR